MWFFRFISWFLIFGFWGFLLFFFEIVFLICLMDEYLLFLVLRGNIFFWEIILEIMYKMVMGWSFGGKRYGFYYLLVV